MPNDAVLLELYNAKMRAYASHVALGRGDVRGVRAGGKVARKAELAFREANAALLSAGGTPEVVQRILQEAVAKTKRKPRARGKL